MVHVSEGLGVNLGDLVVDQEKALLEKGRKIKFGFKLSFAAFLTRV